MNVPVVENVLKLNDQIAAVNRQKLHEAGVMTLDLIGGPGCGKTTLLEATLRELADHVNLGVLVGDLATSRDGNRMKQWSDQVVQINTGRGCHLDANQVQQGMEHLDLEALDILIIENVGNMICPVGFDLGQDLKIAMFSVTDGDDKPAKHPPLTCTADAIILNKCDLTPHVNFEFENFLTDVRAANHEAPILRVSASQGDVEAWTNWLTSHWEHFQVNTLGRKSDHVVLEA